MENTKLNIISIEFIEAKSSNVEARADIHFEGFLLKGFKVIRDKNGKEYVTPPSYLSPQGWRHLFKTDSENDWKEIQRRVLDEYNHKLINELVEGTPNKYVQSYK